MRYCIRVHDLHADVRIVRPDSTDYGLEKWVAALTAEGAPEVVEIERPEHDPTKLVFHGVIYLWDRQQHLTSTVSSAHVEKLLM